MSPTSCHCSIPRRLPGDDLFSHLVARAVPSARERFTTVFGMGTGGSTPPSTTEEAVSKKQKQERRRVLPSSEPGVTLRRPWKRGGASAISAASLQPLPAVDVPSIEQVVFLRPYWLEAMGDLILGEASRLDAFSASPLRA